MFEFLFGFWNYVIVFLVILTVVVFVHEMGHYLVARWNGVKVEVFSVGFGRELFGWNDRSGTRWRVSMLPLGGYVKMFGDADATSTTGEKRELTAEEKAVSFHHKRVGQRAAIVAAGPMANFIFGILVLAIMFLVLGQPRTAPVISEVRPESAAAEAGLLPGDRILAVNRSEVGSFQEIQQIVRLRLGETLTLRIDRDGQIIEIPTQPRMEEVRDALGNLQMAPVLGIMAEAGATEIVRHNPFTATWEATKETAGMISNTFTALGQMIVGTRGTDELGGPLRIAKGAGQAAQLGIGTVVFFTILLSINLGLINLFPIPMLDGGHLLYYGIEALRGRPLSERAQEYGFRIGLFLVFGLMLFATRNDLIDLRVWDLLRGVVS
ncbi:RIP metalloprotease RseP [Telmatospirillum sp. J64-1]|uniref:RIP metalloprotease RseP n=1 Tax=Telmatospirillum sp. J64-1 TaxID=2502183 RepID=UPI0021080A57|nr:RIP metalloprotease RseP [Telmatospirillum sp. J64-1]